MQLPLGGARREPKWCTHPRKASNGNSTSHTTHIASSSSANWPQAGPRLRGSNATPARGCLIRTQTAQHKALLLSRSNAGKGTPDRHEIGIRYVNNKRGPCLPRATHSAHNSQARHACHQQDDATYQHQHEQCGRSRDMDVCHQARKPGNQMLACILAACQLRLLECSSRPPALGDATVQEQSTRVCY